MPCMGTPGSPGTSRFRPVSSQIAAQSQVEHSNQRVPLLDLDLDHVRGYGWRISSSLFIDPPRRHR